MAFSSHKSYHDLILLWKIIPLVCLKPTQITRVSSAQAMELMANLIFRVRFSQGKVYWIEFGMQPALLSASAGKVSGTHLTAMSRGKLVGFKTYDFLKVKLIDFKIYDFLKVKLVDFKTYDFLKVKLVDFSTTS